MAVRAPLAGCNAPRAVMTPEQFARVRAVFDAAMEQSAASRHEFVSQTCADDSEVRIEVERLLEHSAGETLLANVHRALTSALNTLDGDGTGAALAGEMVGRTLSHYKVLEELNRGGMGIVYKALDLKLNREVALKVLPPHLVSDPDRKRRFVREAQSAAALKHPNIAVVYEINEVDGETFIAMELIEGAMLSDALEGGPLSVDRARDLALDVALGLATAHEKGIVHRDVKPANIMVTEDGHAKIIDFGLAKLRVDEDTATERGSSLAEEPTRSHQSVPGAMMGTIGYMSPEQVRAADADARSDIFSLGAVIYEMVSGRTAFGRDTSVDTLLAILNERPPEVEGERGPAGNLMRLARRCLEKAPDARFQSARDLVAELDGVRTQSPAPPSVAILPFTNMSPDRDNEYFSDGDVRRDHQRVR